MFVRMKNVWGVLNCNATCEELKCRPRYERSSFRLFVIDSRAIPKRRCCAQDPVSGGPVLGLAPGPELRSNSPEFCGRPPGIRD